MIKCHNQSPSFNNNLITNEKILIDIPISNETYEDEYSLNIANSNNSNKKFNQKIRKKSSDICYTLNFYEKYGNIYFSQIDTKIFVAKIHKINFDDDYQALFEKGKKSLGNYFKEDLNSIPDITFWYQRYYYYKKFDEGIQMDYESWWSVTPEELAVYIATLCEGKIVADGFCGSGGNVIQFSKYCKMVYAIDIDENKLKICKNNCQVYKCDDNIQFIQSDYLQMAHKIKVDYVFLSPPWGGIKYKDSDIYNIRELMTPNIEDIIKVSLKIARNVIFYLPRTLLIDELFEIMSSILNNQNNGSGERIFFDVHVLKSAKKIKALMIIFGHDIKEISCSDLSSYLMFNYPSISTRNLQILVAIAKVVGNFKFIQTEYYIRKLFLDMSNKLNTLQVDTNFLINHFLNDIMTEQEKIKLKSFNILKNFMIKSFKSNYKKKYTITMPITLNLTMKNFLSNVLPKKLTNRNNNFHPVNEIQIEYLPQQHQVTYSGNTNYYHRGYNYDNSLIMEKKERKIKIIR